MIVGKKSAIYRIEELSTSQRISPSDSSRLPDINPLNVKELSAENSTLSNP